ncbi:MAG: alpha/beta hydrolase family protein [Rhabdochlamydiaceae bacterium]
MRTIHHPDLDVKFLGPSIEKGSYPAVFYFALSSTDSLCVDPFNQPVTPLIGPYLRIFSVSLPDHTENINPHSAIQIWAQKLNSDPSYLSRFIEKVVDFIENLINLEVIDKDNLSVMGLSRGGFMAMHTAALIPHIKHILAFAPVTDLLKLKEFEHFEQNEDTSPYNLRYAIPKLIKKNIRFYIGNRDKRVNTDACYHFMSSLTDWSYQQGISSPPLELIISPSAGHMGHGTLPHIFSDGAKWLLNKMSLNYD